MDKKIKDRLKENFEKYVIRKEGCWDWKGPKDKDGYPQMTCRVVKGLRRGHRISWFIYKGEISEGLCVCHTCDNRICTNPDHLWLGTSLENNDDKVKKKRHGYGKGPQPKLQGSKNPSSKLNEKQVMNIKLKLKNGIGSTEIANQFGVQKACIHKIKMNMSWRHVEC